MASDVIRFGGNFLEARNGRGLFGSGIFVFYMGFLYTAGALALA